MRPIDGDALFAVVKGHHDLYKGATNPTDKARRDECLQVMCDINDAPTVDTIPVEWLRGLMIVYANINTSEYAAYAYCLNNVIEEWQKEQEAR